MSRGVLMYAHNNAEIDYFSIAIANALMVKKNLQVPVTLVTDKSTQATGIIRFGSKFIKQCFDTVIILQQDSGFVNSRYYSDGTLHNKKSLQFYNCNHCDAFTISPYDETLFIDADYFIMSAALDNCWGSHNDFMINKSILEPGWVKDPWVKYIDDFSIPQYWATVIYFKKTELSKHIFNLVGHIQQNYGYYKHLYHFPNGMFRNDYAFSVAVHMMNQFANNNIICELPISGLLMSWDTDDVYSVNNINDITLYAGKSQKGTTLLTRIVNQDIHIMNKWACIRIVDKLIEMYK